MLITNARGEIQQQAPNPFLMYASATDPTMFQGRGRAAPSFGDAGSEYDTFVPVGSANPNPLDAQLQNGTGGPNDVYGGRAGAGATGVQPGATPPQSMSPQDILAQRGIQAAQDRTNRLQIQKWLGGSGGNAVASAGGNVFGAVAGNQLGGFLNYGNALNQAFNSPSGPYGQLQHAATEQRPSKAAEAIAAINAASQQKIAESESATKRQIASLIARAMGMNQPKMELASMGENFSRNPQQYDPRLRRPQPLLPYQR